MDEIQFADGFDAPERLAFGLGAGQLLVVVGGALLAYALLRSSLPTIAAAPSALIVGAAAAVLGWFRVAGRPALDWAVFACRYAARPRSGVLRVDAVAVERNQPVALDAAQEVAAIVPLRPYVLRDGPVIPAATPAAEIAGIASSGLVPRRPSTPPQRVRGGGAHRITFFSLKGGTGRSMLAAELACLLAAPFPEDGRTRPLRVALLDLDVRSPTIGVRLGLVHSNVLDYALAPPDDRRAIDFMATHASGVEVLLGTPEPASDWPLNAGLMRELFRELDIEGMDVVISDISAQVSPLTSSVLGNADDVFVVLTSTSSGVQDAYRSTEALRRLGLRHQLRYIVNRARAGVDFSDTLNDLGGQLIAEVPDDRCVVDAENRQQLVAWSGGEAAAAVHRFGRRVRRELAARRVS